jgi:outer membrane receptor protein involved in Fe transport
MSISKVLQFSIFLSIFFTTVHLHGQSLIRGRVVDASTNSPIAFASVRLTGKEFNDKRIGVPCDENGNFILAVRELPVDLEISSIGYFSERIRVTKTDNQLVIKLKENYLQLQDFVISGDKITAEDLRAPIQVEKLNLIQLQNGPSMNFYDEVANLKGVDITTQSVIINNVNTRGFNSSTNQRFKQFTDGMDNQAPGLGFSLGNLIGPSTLDIESLELYPGPTTALFGPGTFNGVLNMTTKNPFDYQGLSFSYKGSTISVSRDNSKAFNVLNGNYLGDYSVRYAKAIVKNVVAVKVNMSYLKGSDFRATDYRNVGAGAIWEEEHYADNQGIDGVNTYGDERFTYVTLPTISDLRIPTDSVFAVTRNGYREEDLVSFNADNLKFNAALHFNINPNLQLILASFYGNANTMITGDDRMALRDFSIQQHKVELRSNNFLIRGYTTMQNAGNTFNVGRLAETMVQAAKPTDVWINHFEQLYKFGTPFTRFQTQRSRLVANTSFPNNTYFDRFEPYTPAFDSIRAKIISSTEPGYGALIFDESQLQNIDAQLNIHEWDDFFESLIVGGNYRIYSPDSRGTIFSDSVGNTITNYEYGAFLEGERRIDKRTSASASIRYDKNENFEAKSSQRISLTRQKGDNQFFRASFQTGFRFPNIREQFLDQNLGNKRFIGGLAEITDQYDLNGNTILQSTLDEYNNRVLEEINTDIALGREVFVDASRLSHLNVIEDGTLGANNFQGIKPEKITSIEFGYKSLIQDRKVIEFVAYRNYYRDFIGVTRVIKPRTSPSTDLVLATEQANNAGASELFYVTDNAEDRIVTQGIEFLYDVTGITGSNFSFNATYANIITDSDDPVTPGFNTPPFKFNFTFGHRKISRNFGASMSWRSRSSFFFESTFQDGQVPRYSTIDFQFTLTIPGINSNLRWGGNNVFNREQFNSLGGPQIGANYYIAFTYDPFSIR